MREKIHSSLPQAQTEICTFLFREIVLVKHLIIVSPIADGAITVVSWAEEIELSLKGDCSVAATRANFAPISKFRVLGRRHVSILAVSIAQASKHCQQQVKNLPIFSRALTSRCCPEDAEQHLSDCGPSAIGRDSPTRQVFSGPSAASSRYGCNRRVSDGPISAHDHPTNEVWNSLVS